MRAVGFAIFALAATLLAAGCGGSSSPGFPTIGAAKTFHIADFRPAAPVLPGRPATISFRIVQPSGQTLTHYRQGAGPHTGIHLIIVRSDLGALIHKHPPVAADGTLREQVTFPTAGRWRVVVDAYPSSGQQPNFQLFRWLTVSGAAPKQALPAFRKTQDVDGFHVTLAGTPKLRAIQAAFLTVGVSGPDGKPASFTPWFGALAHAIFFRAGTLDYFHTHVCAPGASGCTSALGAATVTGETTAPGTLRVGVLLPVPGTWRLFLQAKADGHVITAPFTLKVGA
jgi:hypothetical protein